MACNTDPRLIDKFDVFLRSNGFRPRLEYEEPDGRRRKKPLTRVNLDATPEVLRFLGMVQPTRLLADFVTPEMIERHEFGIGTSAEIFEVKKLRDTEFVGITTSSGTYISNGFVSHNSGKTSLLLNTIAEAQRQGGTAAFVDTEHALDPQWAQTLGVDIDALYISQPDSGEQALEIVEDLISSGEMDVVVLDSVAALVPISELEGEMGDSVMGAQARLMSQAMRKLNGVVSKTRTLLVFSNQVREKIGVLYGNPEVTPGGRALRFYTTIRLDVRTIKDESLKQEQGSHIKVKVVKNKVAPPFRIAEFNILHGIGFDREDGVLTCGVDRGFVKRAGSHYSLGETKLGKSRDEALQFLRDNPELRGKIEKTVREGLKKKI